MAINKLGKPTDQRMALIKNQASNLFWYGKIETTKVRAKSVQSYAEKLLTLAINTYEDTVNVTKDIKDEKGNVVKQNFVNDGVKKLNARRKLIASLNDLQEQRAPKEKLADYKARVAGINHPLIEKIFNVYAPKYAERAKELGVKGGYTRILNLGRRNGDDAEVAIIELV